MGIPKEILDAAERLGIDITDIILNQLYLKDPSESIRLRLELARKYLAEASEYLNKGDAVQASGKAYKAAEEAVKHLPKGLMCRKTSRPLRKVVGTRTYCLRLARGYPRPSAIGYWMVGTRAIHYTYGVFMRPS